MVAQIDFMLHEQRAVDLGKVMVLLRILIEIVVENIKVIYDEIKETIED